MLQNTKMLVNVYNKFFENDWGAYIPNTAMKLPTTHGAVYSNIVDLNKYQTIQTMGVRAENLIVNMVIRELPDE